MPKILLLMWRKAIAESLLAELRREPGLQLFYEPDYTKAVTSISSHASKVALIEVSETRERNISYCLDVCASIRSETPGCKLILMCSEQDEEAVEQTINAKHEGHIDDFVFYEASLGYLTSKLLATLQH